MKQAMSLILALILCLSLCACGGNKTAKEPGNPAGDEKPTQEMGRIETNHPLLPYLFGTWKQQNEEDAQRNPYTEITFNEDGTCIIEGISYGWVIFEENETSLLFDILSGNEKIAGASLMQNKDGSVISFMAMSKQDYIFCPGVWQNISKT